MSVSRTMPSDTQRSPRLHSFKNYCMCGGYAWQMNGRSQEQPHMTWCPQYAEYAEWWATTHPLGHGSYMEER